VTLSARRTALVAVAGVLFAVSTALPAIASPLTDKQAEAQRVRAQVQDLDAQVEIAVEDFNEADAAYREVSAQVQEVEARLVEVRERIGTLEVSLEDRVTHMYRSGPLGMLEVLLGCASFEEFASLWDLLHSMNEGDAVRIDDLNEARAEAESAESELKDAQAEAKAHRDAMAAAQARVESMLAERKRSLAGIETEVAQLEAQERARAAAVVASSSSRSGSSPSSSRGGNPSRAPKGGVVDIAKSYIGTPYRWGASGPNAFDCSGFTSYVYRQVGVSLPHSSRAQYGCGERVSRANLQPGDLVFFGKSRIHHVGIYVGGGQYIHAPYTGASVRIDSMSRSDYAGACRP
jgi:cell wall-associated NlpC family hydrolase